MNETTRAALSAATETAVLVLVPEAERAAAGHRAHLDMAASWGVPAHLSVVYPFVPAADVDEQVLTELATAVGTVAAAFPAHQPYGGVHGDSVPHPHGR